MTTVFVDTPFFIARINPHDERHELASLAFRSLAPDTSLKTSMPVLIEVMEFFSDLASARQAATAVMEGVIRAPLEGARIDIMELSRRDLLEAFELYGARSHLSFTECLTIVQCRRGHIQSLLSSNPHFEPEGFTLLF